MCVCQCVYQSAFLLLLISHAATNLAAEADAVLAYEEAKADGAAQRCGVGHGVGETWVWGTAARSCSGEQHKRGTPCGQRGTQLALPPP